MPELPILSYAILRITSFCNPLRMGEAWCCGAGGQLRRSSSSWTSRPSILQKLHEQAELFLISVVERVRKFRVGRDACVSKCFKERDERGFLAGGQVQAARWSRWGT